MVIITAVYISPQTGTEPSLLDLCKDPYCSQTSNPDAVLTVAGDFNQANFKKVMPDFYQCIDFAKRGINTATRRSKMDTERNLYLLLGTAEAEVNRWVGAPSIPVALSEHDIRRAFKHVHTKKVEGLDGISGRVLKLLTNHTFVSTSSRASGRQGRDCFTSDWKIPDIPSDTEESLLLHQ